MYKIKRSILLLPIIIIIISCSDNSTNPNVNSEQNKKYSAIIDSIADSLTTKLKSVTFPDYNVNIPGVVLGVWADDKGFSYSVAKGKADISTGRELQVNDLFRIGSITKTFTVTVLLQLVDEKKLSLNDKLSKFFPDFPKADKITIRMLCDMTSGILDYTDINGFYDQLRANPLKNTPPIEFINSIKDSAFNFEPGTGSMYSNTNTYLVGLIIEKITGNKIEQEIKKRIIDRLKMENTFFPIDQYFPSGYSYSKGYDLEDIINYKVDVSEKYSPSWTWSAGSIISNLKDLKIWVKALAEGTLLSAEMQKERLLTVNHCFSGPILEKVTYGLGIINIGGFLGHGGTVMGYNTMILYDPTRKTGVILLLNYLGSTIDNAYKIIKSLYPDFEI